MKTLINKIFGIGALTLALAGNSYAQEAKYKTERSLDSLEIPSLFELLAGFSVMGEGKTIYEGKMGEHNLIYKEDVPYKYIRGPGGKTGFMNYLVIENKNGVNIIFDTENKTNLDEGEEKFLRDSVERLLKIGNDFSVGGTIFSPPEGSWKKYNNLYNKTKKLIFDIKQVGFDSE